MLPGGESTELSVDPAALEAVDADLYRFVLSPVVMAKLGCIHERITQRGRRGVR